MQQQQEDIWTQRAAMGFMQGGFGQPNMTTTNKEEGGNVLGNILGLGLTGASLFFPPAAAAGAAMGAMNQGGGADGDGSALNWNNMGGGGGGGGGSGSWGGWW